MVHVHERTISFAGMSPVVLRQSKLGRIEKVRHGLSNGGRKTEGAYPSRRCDDLYYP